MRKRAARTWKKGSCHCGAVAFEVRTGPEVELVECNCSMCRRTGFLHLIARKTDFRLLAGKRKLTSYKFNTKTAKHLFCSICGVKPFYIPRSHPDSWSVNFRCLDSKKFTSIITSEFDGENWENNVTRLSPSRSA